MGNAVAKYLKLNKDELAEMFEANRKKELQTVPSFVSKQFEVDEIKEKKRLCRRIMPKSDFTGKYIFYIYGGNMSEKIKEEQWEFISSVANETGAAVYVPVYPLAPEHSCAETFAMLIKAYSSFCISVGKEKIILMGDSSGAGLALSLCLCAWNEGLKKPDQLILLSPIMDTEYFDTKLEENLLANSHKEKNIFYNEAWKDYINEYWVKDYAAKMQYTSPYYEDYTDICDDVVLFAGIEDIYNGYDRAFYNKAKKQGVNIRFFEFKNEKHDFLIYSGSPERNKAFRYLIDVINGTYDNALQDIYKIKQVSDWGKRYPEIIDGSSASAFLYRHKFDFSSVSYKNSEYKNLLMVSAYGMCDEKVRKYIMEFPNCTIIQVGCLLDDMFSRLDNGRIQWYSVGSHNNMSIRRAMYGVRDREITVGRNIMDFSWLDEIECPRKKGVMFVFNDSLCRMNVQQIKILFEKLLERFPGAEVAFTTTSYDAMLVDNLRRHKVMVGWGKRKSSMGDTEKTLASWNTEYKIISEEPIMKIISDKKDKHLITKFGILFNTITLNYKIVHIKLGGEVYEITV